MLARDIDVSGSFQFQPFSLQIYIFPSKDYQIQAHVFLNDFILKRGLIYLKFTALTDKFGTKFYKLRSKRSFN